jgi:hypothetical protein
VLAPPDPRTVNAKKREIARRYARKHDKRLELTVVARMRVSQLERLFASRYGQTLPDDDAGRDDLFVAAHHVCTKGGDIIAWASLWAPWLGDTEARKLAARVSANPLRWKADTLAARLNVSYAERQRLKLTTIGAVDVPASGRELLRKQRNKQRKTDARRAKGAKPRAVYEAESAESTRPWAALGISRRTFYRRKKPPSGPENTGGTSAGTAYYSSMGCKQTSATAPSPTVALALLDGRPSLTHRRDLRKRVGER